MVNKYIFLLEGVMGCDTFFKTIASTFLQNCFSNFWRVWYIQFHTSYHILYSIFPGYPQWETLLLSPILSEWHQKNLIASSQWEEWQEYSLPAYDVREKGFTTPESQARATYFFVVRTVGRIILGQPVGKIIHCVKSVQITSFFWSVFSCAPTE